jgi:hypothetical protein
MMSLNQVDVSDVIWLEELEGFRPKERPPKFHRVTRKSACIREGSVYPNSFSQE